MLGALLQSRAMAIIAKSVPIVLGLILVAFGIATAWAMTVQGIFEESSLDVDHLNAGAGNDLLLWRAFLALGAGGLAIIWTFLPGSVAVRLARLAVAPSVLVILVWSVTSLDRFAPGFTEEKFMDVIEAHHRGELVMTTDAIAKLGSPLMTASTSDGDTIWSYTYTPSGGFGWPKRFLTFDAQGRLVYTSSFDEP